MATIANPNANNSSSAADHSPRHSTVDNNHPVNSLQSRRGSVSSGSSPWKQIVRGESESAPGAVAAASSSSNSAVEPQVSAMSAGSSSYSAAVAVDGNADNENGPVTGNAGRRLAWNKPSNGALEIGPVMGADSWPALSESARISVKSSSSDSMKGQPDGSSTVHVSQVPGTALSSSQKQPSIANTNSAPTHPIPTRQRSMKRDGASTSSNGGTTQPPGSHGMGGELALNNPHPGEHGRTYPVDHGRRFSSRNGNDHPSQQRNSSRNHGGSHWGRRDQDRANHDWNPHRNFSNRDAHMQPHRGTPRFMRPPPPPPPPPTTHFVVPPPMRPYTGSVGYHELRYMYYIGATTPDSHRAVPFIAPMPPPVPFSAPDFQLHYKIVNQIEYYFSNENLIKDTFLRQNMDDQGWVPIKLIAGFNKVSHLTDNIQLILESIRNSTVVEVQGDKVRRQKDWMRWIMPTTLQFSNVSSPRSPGSPNSLAANVQTISVEEKTSSKDNAKSHSDVHTDAFPATSLSGDLNNQSQLLSSGEAAEVGARGGLDSPSTRRNSNK